MTTTTPPSEHRLHPVALLLFIGGQFKEVALALAAWLAATWFGDGGFALGGTLIVAAVAGAIVFVPSLARLLTFRFAYGAGELVLRWGLLFRHERHIPFQRIQNLDARETLLHRATGTVKVLIETGGGAGEAEATIEAVPRAAFELMRSRVLTDPATPQAAEAGSGTTLVALGPRELILTGLILNRGMIVVGGLLATAAELGFGDRLLEAWLGEDPAGGTTRTAMELLSGARTLDPAEVAIGVGALMLFLVLVRIFSMALTMVRYHEHRLVLIADDLRVSYGLLTRVSNTTPRRRIQTVTIREGPWHRLAGRVTIQAVTAGGSLEGHVASREMLAPLVRREAITELLAAIVPGTSNRAAAWNRAAPAARRRAFRRNLIGWSAPLVGAAYVGVPALALVAALAAWSLAASLGRVRRFAWQEIGDLLVLRTGWIWRRTTFVRHDRIQGVVATASPFDRHHRMQRVAVDTAGITTASLELPYLTEENARALTERLAAGAASTAFRL